jgi:hypothetical protein
VGSEYYRCKEKVKSFLENKKNSYLLTEFVFSKWECKNNNLLTEGKSQRGWIQAKKIKYLLIIKNCRAISKKATELKKKAN